MANYIFVTFSLFFLSLCSFTRAAIDTNSGDFPEVVCAGDPAEWSDCFIEESHFSCIWSGGYNQTNWKNVWIGLHEVDSEVFLCENTTVFDSYLFNSSVTNFTIVAEKQIQMGDALFDTVTGSIFVANQNVPNNYPFNSDDLVAIIGFDSMTFINCEDLTFEVFADSNFFEFFGEFKKRAEFPSFGCDFFEPWSLRPSSDTAHAFGIYMGSLSVIESEISFDLGVSLDFETTTLQTTGIYVEGIFQDSTFPQFIATVFTFFFFSSLFFFFQVSFF